MELLAFHNQFIADFPPHHKQDDLHTFDIIQDAEVADAQLELRKRVGTQPPDGLRLRCRLVKETGLDRRLQKALLADRQRTQLRFGICRDGDLERHRCPRISLRAQAARPVANLSQQLLSRHNSRRTSS
jgi:hypothetical protein